LTPDDSESPEEKILGVADELPLVFNLRDACTKVGARYGAEVGRHQDMRLAGDIEDRL
jgi:hypothetical protein